MLKELVDPKGALIDLAAIPSGDPTLSSKILPWHINYLKLLLDARVSRKK